MYATLDLNSFNSVTSTTPTDIQSLSISDIIVSPKNIITDSQDHNNHGGNQKSRSKTGCLTCKQRKRKCDEIHPTCTYCDKRGIKCEWSMLFYNNNKIVTKKVRKPQPSTTQTITKSSSFTSSLDINDLLESINNNQSINGVDLLTTTSSSTELITTNDITDEEDPMPLYINLSSTFNLFLDDNGLNHLDFFESKVAPLISISPQSSNYFLKTFFTLAITNESISNGLAAWGALFDNNLNDTDKYVQMNKYIERGNALVEATSTNDKFDSFVKLAYYLILIGIQVCAGDTKHWHEYLQKCVKLFKDYGGLSKFLNDFTFSNDCKFLVSNFQFHDIMSSETLKNGTICSMTHYNDLFKFNKILELDNYGIDPYQGCIQSIYLLLGEIMNTYVALKEERINLNHLLNESHNSNPDAINNLRLSYFKRINEKITELDNKIDFCQPNQNQLNQLSYEDQANHLKLFELYRITCKMYLFLYIKQTQPISSEIQNYLIKAQTIINELVETNLVSSLNMSLLICGISCCNTFDRQNLNSKFLKVYEKYHVGNVRRIWDVVKESWSRNKNGNICIDWLDICNDFGWKISMC